MKAAPRTIINDPLIFKALRNQEGEQQARYLEIQWLLHKVSFTQCQDSNLTGRLGAKKPSPLFYDSVPSCQVESLLCYSSALSQTRPQTPILSILVQISNVCYYS